MPLPIPDILFNASQVIEASAKFLNDKTSRNTEDMAEALKKVHPGDLASVLNEVGAVYSKLNNIQAIGIGSRADLNTKNVEVSIMLEYGFGPRPVTVSMTPENAIKFANQIIQDSATITFSKGGLILDAGKING